MLAVRSAGQGSGMGRVLRAGIVGAAAFAASLAVGSPAAAAEAGGLDGRALGILWCAPFAGLILSIALFPLLAPGFWGRHYGKVAAFWCLAFLLPLVAV